jgi:hypothetical protein
MKKWRRNGERQRQRRWRRQSVMAATAMAKSKRSNVMAAKAYQRSNHESVSENAKAK